MGAFMSQAEMNPYYSELRRTYDDCRWAVFIVLLVGVYLAALIINVIASYKFSRLLNERNRTIVNNRLKSANDWQVSSWVLYPVPLVNLGLSIAFLTHENKIN